jgi:hypothetical protein
VVHSNTQSAAFVSFHLTELRGNRAIEAWASIRRKMEDERRRAAGKKAAEQRATNPQIIEDAERLIVHWNESAASPRWPRSGPPSGNIILILDS